MRQSNSIRNHLDRISILLGKKVSQESALQSMHATLLQDGFYLNFRLHYDSILRQLRLNHEESLDVNIVRRLSSKEISLGAKQKLILRTIHSLNFNKALVYSKISGTKIWFPLDRQWQRQLSDFGFRVNRPICTLLLGMFKVISTAKSISKLAVNEFEAIKSHAITGTKYEFQNPEIIQIFMSGFSEANYPNVEFPTHNFYDWLSRKLGTSSVYLHDCKERRLSNLESPQLHFQNTIVPKIPSIDRVRAYLRLLSVLIRYLFNPKLKFFELVSQIDEVILALQLFSSSQDERYELLIFPSTVLVYKPLWSVFLENSGTKVVVINYTAMAEPLSPNLTRVVDGIWHLSSWNDMWVVDRYQETQMKLTSEYAAKNYTITGVPHWSGRVYSSTPYAGRKCIAVFDTHIRSNQTFSAGVVDEMGWNNTKLEEEFISIVLQAASHFDLIVLHKKKRKVPQFQKTRTDELTQKLKSLYKDRYQVVDESFSAVSLIELSIGVVSKPISTTAFVATEMRKPSIILDPTMNVQFNDPGLRDCKIAYSPEHLQEIFKSILDSA